MTTAAKKERDGLLFQRARTTKRDQTVFVGKLLVAGAIGTVGVLLGLQDGWAGKLIGVFVLGALYAHMVELQHQCLHHSAFTAAKPHRIVGIPLGLPMLVSFSHYRVRHLQHHASLGTPQDSEFFGFDTRAPLTWSVLARGTFSYDRFLIVAREIVRSWRGTWKYDAGQIAERRRREIIIEYRMMILPIAAAVVAVCAGYGDLVLQLWLLPLLVAIPMHFLLELPEHILCDSDTTDVLRNTRSIKGSWFSTWYTNGNNLHVEHHAAMTVAINRLRERHGEVTACAKFVERSYPDFYRAIVREANRNSGRSA
ncbi:fatty acid desaturase [Streptomyces ficellus]|uniref:Fatty acid desaturase n=1 Tax=Streptomyces ficellus TaxID=1977088 RepID=A0ABT7Z630_9ACTN|nr:fatty acid desaturase [Streptomyces ficellus]MDN3294962.1 fatty acid desaturase [Streptomyces ficellus]